MLKVTELSIVLKRIGLASYANERDGITFRRFVLFQLNEKVATDRLLVTDEAVRVLNKRE
ncbi:MAG: hypothetical protein OK422_01960 [Thaumarchaeota archaeon]|nr:hypothetical protein [Nitrososphaerota archaeon]